MELQRNAIGVFFLLSLMRGFPVSSLLQRSHQLPVLGRNCLKLPDKACSMLTRCYGFLLPKIFLLQSFMPGWPYLRNSKGMPIFGVRRPDGSPETSDGHGFYAINKQYGAI